VTSLDGIKDVLAPHFDLYREPQDLPLSLKKTTRTSEKRLVQVTVWKMRG
jgi:hypothetical protein